MSGALKEIGEFGFIQKISRGCLIRNESVVKAIGDDAAAFWPAPNGLTLVTTDLLVERIHFVRDAISGFDLGYKSLAVNLSDIAAMGGTAREAFVSLAIPGDCALDYLEALYEGMKSMAGTFDVNILGGDTTRSVTDLVINVGLTGTVPETEMLCRKGARPGDRICTTGYLGDSRGGLHLILNDIEAVSEDFKKLLRAHLKPKPYLHEGRFLACQNGVTAAIDISDGLSSDLQHILVASDTGACLHADQIPVSDSLYRFCDHFGFDPLVYAVSGGEDYTLLCTVSPDRLSHLQEQYLNRFDQPLYVIGKITDTRNMEMVDKTGKSSLLEPTGWDHFKENPRHAR